MDWLGAGSWGWLTGALPAPSAALLVPAATLGLLWLYLQAGPGSPTSADVRARGGRRGRKGETAAAAHYPGLHNHGNSCFLNSTLQSLASLRLLGAFLLQQAADRCPEELEAPALLEEPTPPADDESFTSLLFDLCVDLNEPGPRRAMSPLPLIYKLQRRQPRLMDRDQQVGDGWRDSSMKHPHPLHSPSPSCTIMHHMPQDAHEFFQLLSGLITDETRALAGAQMQRAFWIALRRLPPSQATTTPAPRTRSHPRVPAPGRIPLDNATRLPRLSSPFAGLLASRMTCRKCLYSTPVRHSAFDNLSLPVGAVRGVRVEDLLAAYMEGEEIEGWMCAKCTLTHTTWMVGAEVEKLELVLARAKEGPGAVVAEPAELAPSPRRRGKVEKLLQDLHARIGRKREHLARLKQTLAYDLDSGLVGLAFREMPHFP